MSKTLTYYGFCPWGHGGTITLKTAINPEHYTQHCVHCGAGLVMANTAEEVYTIRSKQ